MPGETTWHYHLDYLGTPRLVPTRMEARSIPELLVNRRVTHPVPASRLGSCWALLILAAAAGLAAPSGGQDVSPGAGGPGDACDAAAEVALAQLTNLDQLGLQARSEDELWIYGSPLGGWAARTEQLFDLAANKPLLKSCLGDDSADVLAASFEILRRVWRRLQGSELTFEGLMLRVVVNDANGWRVPSARLSVCRVGHPVDCRNLETGDDGEVDVEFSVLDRYRLVVSLAGFLNAELGPIDLQGFKIDVRLVEPVE